MRNGRQKLVQLPDRDSRAITDSDSLMRSRAEHPMALYATSGSVYASWLRARAGHDEADVAELEQAVAAYADQGNKLYLPLCQCLLAEIEGLRSSDGLGKEAD